ncbi:MAG TPA: glycosyltransferase family 39 protein [Cyanophyceae cyanobacterium]
MKSEWIPTWRLPPTWLRFLVVVILVIGVFFRFYNIEKKVYWHDEVYTSIRSLGYTGAEVFHDIFNGRVIEVQDLQKYQHPNPEKTLGDTIHSLIQHPEHPPLYYLLARFWMQLFGDWCRTPRGLSALFSLLVLPCLYWLCLELFNSSLVGWIAVILMAISPFHVLYAQEAREYSLWTVTILLSSTALLRAIRLKNWLNWGIYTITLSLSFYVSLFSGFVALGHGIYMTLRENFRFTKQVWEYFLASVVALIIFAPWMGILITNLSKFQEKTSWVKVHEARSYLLKIWGLHLSSLFLDFGLSIEHIFTYLVPPVLLGGVGYGVYFLCRHTPKEVWGFILTLIGVTAIALILPDLIVGGRRSVSSRYFIPCYLGIQITVAYLLATQILNPSFFKQKLWQGTMAVLISLGIISCSISSQADTWWNKVVSYYNPKIASIINQSPQPLIISDPSDVSIGNVISLSYLLKPKARFQLVVDPNIPEIPDRFSDVFLFYPSQDLQQIVKKEYNAKLEPASKRDSIKLFKLVQS